MPGIARRREAEYAYPKLISYKRVDKGGHFAAWEQPELFAADSFALKVLFIHTGL